MKTKRWSWILVAWLIVGWFASEIALAEGRRDTFIEGARTGFNSQAWRDNDDDNVQTIVLFANCRLDSGGAPTNFNSTRIELRRINDLRPDDNAGEDTLQCYNLDRARFGDVRESRYKFRINLINNGTSNRSMNADPVQISW